MLGLENHKTSYYSSYTYNWQPNGSPQLQLGISEGSGSTYEKRHTKIVKNRIRLVNIVFQIQKWRKYCRRFVDIVALKISDSYCYFLSPQGRKENFWNHTFFILEKRPFLMQRALPNGTFAHLLKMVGGKPPGSTPSCAPALL